MMVKPRGVNRAMSGGSWNYVCFKIESVVERLSLSDSALRRALGAKLKPFAKALHDIEWVDSGDYGPSGDVEAIKAALGDDWKERTLAELVEEHKQLLDEWKDVVEREENNE